MELYRRLKRENDAYRTNIEAQAAARTQQLKNALKNLEMNYDVTLEALGDAQKEARKARDQNLDVKTWSAVMRDRAIPFVDAGIQVLRSVAGSGWLSRVGLSHILARF